MEESESGSLGCGSGRHSVVGIKGKQRFKAVTRTWEQAGEL